MKIKLRKPHTHAGREYPAGSVLDTVQCALDDDSAAWLLAIGVAEEAAAERHDVGLSAGAGAKTKGAN